MLEGPAPTMFLANTSSVLWHSSTGKQQCMISLWCVVVRACSSEDNCLVSTFSQSVFQMRRNWLQHHRPGHPL